MSKKRLLLYSDSPEATTGLGRMSRHFIEIFKDEYDIDIIASNHNQYLYKKGRMIPVWDKERYQCMIFPPYVANPLDPKDDTPITKALIENNVYDIIITNRDIQHIFPNKIDYFLEAKKKNQKCKIIMINFFDSKYVITQDAEQVEIFDHIVFCSQYARNKFIGSNPSLKDKSSVIYPALDLINTNDEQIEKIKDVFAKTFANYPRKSKFTIGQVNRATFRKDLPKTLEIVSKYMEKNQKAVFYSHSKNVTDEGLNLYAILVQYGVDPTRFVFADMDFEADTKYNDETLYSIYKQFDVYVSTSTGEGFGYTAIEALYNEVPVIVPSNTTFPELVQDYGYIVEANEETVATNHSSMVRERVSTEKFLDTLHHVYKNPEEAKEKAKAGRQYVIKNFNIARLKKEWNELLQSLS